MNKRVLLFLVIGILMVFIMAILMLFFFKPGTKDAILYVNNKTITDEHIKIKKNYAEVPLIKVIEGLGIHVKWSTDTSGEFICQNTKYNFNLLEGTLIKTGTSDNLIKPAPGTDDFICKPIKYDIILDDDTIKSILFLMGETVYINVDYKRAAVFIEGK